MFRRIQNIFYLNIILIQDVVVKINEKMRKLLKNY